MSGSAAAQVLAELKALRRGTGGVTVDAVAAMPTLTALLGAGDPALAYTRLQHHLLDGSHGRSITAASASLGFSSGADTHLGRLEDAGHALSVDQRHARRLSDEGLVAIAALVTSNWLVEAAPSLSLAVVAEPDAVLILVQVEWPGVIEMHDPAIAARVGEEEPLPLPAEWRRGPRGDRCVLATVTPLAVARSDRETSVTVTWRGEAWPKFTCTLHGVHPDAVVETLGNRLMLRLWGTHGA